MVKTILDVNEILNDYSYSIQESIEEEAKSIAKETAKELKASNKTYKIRTGQYNKGWAVKTQKSKGEILCTVYNSKQWQLTHLLEKGHINRDGKTRTKPYVHIAPVEEKQVTKYTRNVERIINNGG